MVKQASHVTVRVGNLPFCIPKCLGCTEANWVKHGKVIATKILFTYIYIYMRECELR